MIVTADTELFTARRIKLLTGFLLGLLWICGSAKSSPTELQIESTLGFSGTVRLGRWAPLTVTVENLGVDVDGILEVDVTSGDELAGTAFSTIWQRDLVLIRGTRKRFHFTVFIDNISEPIEIRIVTAGKVVARQSIDLRQSFTDSRLLLVLSRNADLDYLNENSSDRLRVIYPHPDLLPTQWQGYDGVSAVIVHGVTLERWSERQYEALQKWLAQGGNLIVSGGPDYAALRTARIAELLPVIPSGLITIDNDAHFRETLGSSFVASRPFQVHQIANTDGKIALSAAQTPLIVNAEFGLGRVSYLTFDIGAYPFVGWSGMEQFWRRHLDLLQTEAYRSLPSIDTSVVPTLIRGASKRFPHKTAVFSFLIGYLGVLVAAYRIDFQGSGSLRGAPWIIPLCFTPTAFLVFVVWLSPAGITVMVASVIEPLRRGSYALLELDLGVYSNHASSFTLNIEQTTAVFLPRVDPYRPDKVSSWKQQAGDAVRLQVMEQRPYVLHTLLGSDIVVFDLDVSARNTESGLNVEVQNQTEHSLKFAWMVFDGWFYPLGTVAANGASSFQVDDEQKFSMNDRNAITAYLASIPSRELPALQSVLSLTVSRYRNAPPLMVNEALFVAVPESTWPVLTPGPAMQTTDVTLVLFRFAVPLSSDNAIGIEARKRDAR